MAAPAHAAVSQGSGLAATLSFLAGYVDTLGFIALFGLFTAHVTGNFVLIGRELVQSEHDVLLKLLAFPTFVASVALTRLLLRAWQRRRWPALRLALLLQLLLLAGAAASGWHASPIAHAQAPWAMATGLLCVAAMALQNAYCKLLLPQLGATTVMTGNVTQLVIEVVDTALAVAQGESKSGAALLKLFWPVLAFAAGAVAGALAVSRAGLAALLLPCLLLAGLAAISGAALQPLARN